MPTDVDAPVGQEYDAAMPDPRKAGKRPPDARLAPPLHTGLGQMLMVIAALGLLAVIAGALLLPLVDSFLAMRGGAPVDGPDAIAEARMTTGRIGIVSGHWGYDAGAVCPSGLTEAEVNRGIALETVQLLERKGYQVDLLDEFDERLRNYQAQALVSIHADSCTIPGPSGFKVARLTQSAIPAEEDRLVACLYRSYEEVTGLPRHTGSVTDDMTNYHAFREIHNHTPGAIIEAGFLLEDAWLIVQLPHIAAEGIARGISCFLEGE